MFCTSCQKFDCHHNIVNMMLLYVAHLLKCEIKNLNWPSLGQRNMKFEKSRILPRDNINDYFSIVKYTIEYPELISSSAPILFRPQFPVPVPILKNYLWPAHLKDQTKLLKIEFFTVTGTIIKKRSYNYKGL